MRARTVLARHYGLESEPVALTLPELEAKLAHLETFLELETLETIVCYGHKFFISQFCHILHASDALLRQKNGLDAKASERIQTALNTIQDTVVCKVQEAMGRPRTGNEKYDHMLTRSCLILADYFSQVEYDTSEKTSSAALNLINAQNSRATALYRCHTAYLTSIPSTQATTASRWFTWFSNTPKQRDEVPAPSSITMLGL